MITLEQFKECSENLKQFMEERQVLEQAIKAISPTSTGVVEVGGKFIDDYIKLASLALEDNDKFFEWFVYENNFGKRKYEVRTDGQVFTIANEDDLYNFLIKNK